MRAGKNRLLSLFFLVFLFLCVSIYLFFHPKIVVYTLQHNYTLRTEGDTLILSYAGYGKLADGTLEPIDASYTMPRFSYEDQTAGDWRPPDEAHLTPRDLLNDPTLVFNPSRD